MKSFIGKMSDFFIFLRTKKTIQHKLNGLNLMRLKPDDAVIQIDFIQELLILLALRFKLLEQIRTLLARAGKALLSAPFCNVRVMTGQQNLRNLAVVPDSRLGVLRILQ